MAVETRYVVIRTDRNNEEQEVMTFTDKRSADDYDKMLDMADAMFEVLHASSIELSEQDCEDLSVYLAKQRDDVLYALQAKKKQTISKKSKNKTKDEQQTDMLTNDDAEISPQSLSETLLAEGDVTDAADANEENAKASEDNLVDFVIEKDDAA
jgi:dsDNA-binding SOS-regulon protein